MDNYSEIACTKFGIKPDQITNIEEKRTYKKFIEVYITFIEKEKETIKMFKTIKKLEEL